MYARVEPSGCTERYGLVQVRLSMCLEEGDQRWGDRRFYQVDQASAEFLFGYQGLVDVEGNPLDQEQYAAWEKSLPRVWLAERSFHNHFIYLDPYTMRDEDIEAAIAHHLPNFYKAWVDEWDKVPGGMRHGWDVACRKPRPKRFDKLEPENYLQRRLEALSKVDILRASSIVLQVTGVGETFPATEIDVGSAAINRASSVNLYYDPFTNYFTFIDYNNAANDTGSIDTAEFYVASPTEAGNSCKVGTFADNGSNSFTCNDAESIGEIATSGADSATGLDIDINAGEFIGMDCRTAKEVYIDRATSGGSGVYYANGQYCDATDEQTYTLQSGDIMSLYGTGETAGGGVTPKIAVGAKMVGIGAI